MNKDTNPYASPKSALAEKSPLRERNLLVSVVLIALIGWNLIAALGYLSSYMGYVEPGEAGQSAFVKAGFITILNAVFIGAILFWKKIGAYGLIAIGTYAFLSNTTRLGLMVGVINALPVVFILGLLFVGGKKKIWPQLS